LLPDKKWIRQLIHPGTSLGGARPKASVVDEQQMLQVAKFPSRKDDYDVEIWEHFCHLLAKKAGINAASTRILPAESKHHILLSKRFDRTDEGKRIHFASAMTLLGLTDGDDAGTGKGYLDIVDFIIQSCTNVEANLQELYRRVAFNICVGNTDDHFRNHGFLLAPKGWTLSPAYDMNPTLNEQQHLLISSSSNESDLNILLNACEEYMIDRETATKIIKGVISTLKRWKQLAVRVQIPKSEIDMFGYRFEKYAAWLEENPQ
jgi:serine/threonine-protein kinase HipA